MKTKPIFSYKNLHEYLDKNLSGSGITHPSKAEIKRLKKKYWRLRNTYYKRLKRWEQREVTLYFTDSEVKQLQKRQAENQSLPKLVHSLVMASLNNESIFITKHAPELEQLLFQIVDNLEDLIEHSPIHIKQLQLLQDQVQELEKHFEA